MRRWWGLIFCSDSSPCSRPSMPSMRGTENPQMSASMTPTVKPSAASAAARLTVTDDLPTPPLPEAIMMTLVVGGMAVCSGRSAMLRRARSIAAAFSSWSSSVQSMRTLVTPGSDVDPGLDVLLDLGPQRAARGGEGDAHVHDAVGVDACSLGHAQVDDVGAELGVDHAAQQAHHVRLRRQVGSGAGGLGRRVGGVVGNGGGGHGVILPVDAVLSRSGASLGGWHRSTASTC